MNLHWKETEHAKPHFKSRNLRSSIGLIAVLVIGLIAGFFTSFAMADTSTESFYPTWKLLTPDQKNQFIAGYLCALRDAEKITHVANEFSHENPEQALRTLHQLHKVFDSANVKPDVVVRGIDSFYSDPQNTSASLSKAVRAASQYLR